MFTYTYTYTYAYTHQINSTHQSLISKIMVIKAYTLNSYLVCQVFLLPAVRQGASPAPAVPPAGSVRFSLSAWFLAMPGGLKMMKLAMFDNGTYTPNLAIFIKENDDKQCVGITHFELTPDDGGRERERMGALKSLRYTVSWCNLLPLSIISDAIVWYGYDAILSLAVSGGTQHFLMAWLTRSVNKTGE